MRFDKRQLVGGDVVFQIHGPELRLGGEAAQFVLNLRHRQVEAGGDLGQLLRPIALLVAQQQDGGRRAIIHNDAAFAVEDLAAGRENGNGAHAIALRQHFVFIAADDLQVPQAQRQHHKHQQDAVLHGGEFDGGNFVVAGHGKKPVVRSQ